MMMISLTFRNTEGEEWQKEYLEDRLKKLEKYADNPVDARVVLSVEKFRNVAEINLATNGLNINAKEEDKEMYAAIDNAVDKIERQLKKQMAKIRQYKNDSVRSEGSEAAERLDDDVEYGTGNKVAEIRKMSLKPMSLEDAVLELETTRNMFIVYRDAATEEIKVLYRRDDGKYTLIETKG